MKVNGRKILSLVICMMMLISISPVQLVTAADAVASIDVSVDTSGGSRTVTVSLDSVEVGSVILMGMYLNGALADLQYKTYEGEDVVFTIDAVCDEIKVFAWKSLDSAAPVSDIKTIEVNPMEFPAASENYAVILRSFYDEVTDDAYVELGFSDDTKSTFKIGKLNIADSANPESDSNDKAEDFAFNKYFGAVVKFKHRSDGSVDLSFQNFKTLNARNTVSRYSTGAVGTKISDGVFSDWAGNTYDSFDIDAPIFFVYGNPCYIQGGSYDPTGIYYAPVKSEAYRISELNGTFESAAIDSICIGTQHPSAYTVASYVLNSVDAEDQHVVAAAMTIGAERESIYTVEGIVVANEMHCLETDPYGNELQPSIQPTYDANKSIIYYTSVNANGYTNSNFLAIDRGLGDEYLGKLVDIRFKADVVKDSNGIIIAMNNIKVLGNVVVNSNTVSYEVDAIDVDVYPNGQIASSKEITPYISFMADGAEKKIYADENICGKLPMITDAKMYDEARAAFAAYSYTFDSSLHYDDSELFYADESFIDDMGEAVLSKYRFVSIDGGKTYSYMFKTVSDNYVSALYTSVTAMNDTSIKLADTGTLDLEDCYISEDVAVDSPVVAYRTNGKVVIDKVDVVTGALEDFADNGGIVIGGNTYYPWFGLELDCSENTLFSFYQENPEARSYATYYAYNGMIMEIDMTQSVVPADKYAVILKSHYDEKLDAAYVKLGFADNTEGTYQIGKTYLRNANRPNDAANAGNRAKDFAQNAYFGLVVQYSILNNGTVDLSAQDFAYSHYNTNYIRGAQSISARVDDGKVTFNGTEYYAYDDSSVLFVLYGNPFYGTDGEVHADGDTDGNKQTLEIQGEYAPVRARAYKINEVGTALVDAMPNAFAAATDAPADTQITDYAAPKSPISGSIYAASIAFSSSNATNKFVTAMAITQDETGPNVTGANESNYIAYIVSATQKYNVATSEYYAIFNVISEEGVQTLTTVDDVPGLTTAQGPLPSNYIGNLSRDHADFYAGGFIRYDLNKDGKISALDVDGIRKADIGDGTGTWDGSLQLVNIIGTNNDIISYYPTDTAYNPQSGTGLRYMKLDDENPTYIVGIDDDNYVGETITTLPADDTANTTADKGNAIIEFCANGKIRRVFSFVDGWSREVEEQPEEPRTSLLYGIVTALDGTTVTIDNYDEYKLSECEIASGIAVGDSVVIYPDSEPISIEKPEIITGAVDDFTDDGCGVVINGNTYSFSIDFNSGCCEPFAWYLENNQALESATYYVHNGVIAAAEIPIGTSSYAVILKSEYDENLDAAYVKLGFADNTEGTYEVSKTRLRNTKRPNNAANAGNRAQDFAQNAYFGLVVQYTIKDNGTVDLSGQDFADADYDANYIRGHQAISARVDDGKVTFNGTEYYAYDDNSVLFVLYGNPFYGTDGEVHADGDTDGNKQTVEIQGEYAPVRARAYKINEVGTAIVDAMPNAFAAATDAPADTSTIDYAAPKSPLAGDIYAASIAFNSNTALNRYVTALSMTVGSTLPFEDSEDEIPEDEFVYVPSVNANDYAVILKSEYDAQLDVAYVKLGFADNTEGTYQIGKTYLRNANRPNDAANAGNRAKDFAQNAYFGLVVQYSILNNGTVDLSAQDFAYSHYDTNYIRGAQSISARVDDGKVTFNGTEYYAYDDNSVLFVLYGNPFYGTDGEVHADGDTDGNKQTVEIQGEYAPVRARAYKITAVGTAIVDAMPNVFAAATDAPADTPTIDYAAPKSPLAGDIYAASIAFSSLKPTNKYVVAMAITQDETGSNVTGASESNYIAYIVSATQKYNAATSEYYAVFNVINEDGLQTLTTVDDVPGLTTAQGPLPSNYIGNLSLDFADFAAGGFIRYDLNDEGKISALDVDNIQKHNIGDGLVTTDGSLQLVNVIGTNNDIISYYPTDTAYNPQSGMGLRYMKLDDENPTYIVGIDDDNYVGETITTLPADDTAGTTADKGNAIIEFCANGKIRRVFSFVNGWAR